MIFYLYNLLAKKNSASYQKSRFEFKYNPVKKHPGFSEKSGNAL